MGRLASVMRPLVDGERAPEKLCEGLDAQTEGPAPDILRELARLDVR
jgi:hypothetical protein